MFMKSENEFLEDDTEKVVSNSDSERSASWRSSLAGLPSIGVAVLPVGVCPACWPAYAGILGSLGFGFLLDTTYLFFLTAVFLLVALGSIAFRARAGRGYGPFAVGLLASVMVVLGKFVFDSNTALYGGIVMLVVAAIWNAWPGNTHSRCCASACLTAGAVGRDYQSSEIIT